MLNYNIKFLTSEETLHLKNSDFKTYKYETKKKIDESIYDVGKRTYSERRSGHWKAVRPRQMRQLESKLKDKSIVTCEWTTESLITLVLSSGAIAYLTVKLDTLDVIQVLFDRYCVGKLAGQTVSDVVMCQSHILFTHADKSATLITFGKSPGNRQPCRISDRDPHIQTIELGGGARRSERRVSWCDSSKGVKVLVWSTNTAEPAPWSPVVEDHANLHLYHINGQHMSLVAYHQLENETLSAEISSKSDTVVHIVDQITCHKNGVSLEWFHYEIPNSIDRVTKMAALRESVTRVPLPAPARATRRSPCDLKLLTACIDGTLHIVHSAVGITHSVRAGFIASEVVWAGALVVAAAEGGRVQCFDRALALLHHHTKCFDFTTYLRDAKRTQILATRESKGGPQLLVSFAGGPLALLHITHPRLLTAWLRSGRASNAVALLHSMDWATEGAECLWALNRLVCEAMRSPTEASGEATAQVALGAFLAPRAPLPAAANRFAPPVHDLARKFFHHLLRRGRLDKALSLAVELRAWDLCRDTEAASHRRPDLAQEAHQLALHYASLPTDSECSDSCSQCSSSSYTDDESASEVYRTKPPPLPRVSLPSPTPPQPYPRQNSHQYLDRDTWNNTDEYAKVPNDKIKPILNQRWHSLDNSLNTRLGSMNTLSTICEVSRPTTSVVDIVPRQDERMTSQFSRVYQTELREEVPRNQYQKNYPTMNDRSHRGDVNADNAGRSTEKNKVKFSDTVTIAVVAEASRCPDGVLPESTSFPHKYISPPAGTSLDYVEV